jgi:hypothetical protein
MNVRGLRVPTRRDARHNSRRVNFTPMLGQLARRGRALCLLLPALVGCRDYSIFSHLPDGQAPSDGAIAGDAGLALAGLIGDWQLDEGAGQSVSDSSGGGHNGMVFGSPSWVPGVSGSALMFNGNGSVQVASAPSLSNLPAITVSAWIKLNAAGAVQCFLSKRHSSSPYLSYEFQVGADDRIGFVVVTAAGTSAGRSSQQLVTDRWYHVVGIYDGATVAVYLDGAADGFTNPASGAVVTSDGNLSFPYMAFNGAIDAVRIYGRALSAAEVAALHEHP